jgi:hypothetical protein
MIIHTWRDLNCPCVHNDVSSFPPSPLAAFTLISTSNTWKWQQTSFVLSSARERPWAFCFTALPEVLLFDPLCRVSLITFTRWKTPSVEVLQSLRPQGSRVQCITHTAVMVARVSGSLRTDIQPQVTDAFMTYERLLFRSSKSRQCNPC